MNKKISLSVLLTLAMVFTLSACGGQATMEGGTTDPDQIVEGDTGDNGDVTLDQLSDTNYPIQIKPLLQMNRSRT